MSLSNGKKCGKTSAYSNLADMNRCVIFYSPQQCKRENKNINGITRFLKSLIKDKNKLFVKKDMDRYKRIVAICYYDNHLE